MFPYISHTHDDEQEMLKSIGLTSLDQLFDDIPKKIQLGRDLDLRPAMSELEVSAYLMEMANKNCSASKLTCFLGAGAYDHYISYNFKK